MKTCKNCGQFEAIQRLLRDAQGFIVNASLHFRSDVRPEVDKQFKEMGQKMLVALEAAKGPEVGTGPSLKNIVNQIESETAPPTSGPAPSDEEKAKRNCNLHNDCDAANAKARAAGRAMADHCHNDCCPDCFGQ